MSLTVRTADLSDRYSWKNFTMLELMANAAMTAKTMAMAFTGCVGQRAARFRAAARYQGSGASASVRGPPSRTISVARVGPGVESFASNVAMSARVLPGGATRASCSFNPATDAGL